MATISRRLQVPERPTDGRPLAIIADTIKGRGVSFMEHTAMEKDQEYYQYHSELHHCRLC